MALVRKKFLSWALSMPKASEDITNKVSVVRRLVFAFAVLPPDCPHHRDIVSSFASSREDNRVIASGKNILQFVEPDSLNLYLITC